MKILAALVLGLLFLSMPSMARAACSAPVGQAGTVLYNSDHNVMQYCNDSVWVGMGGGGGGSGGGAADMISAFAATTCPAGWSEYTPARGRFLRGIDNGAGNDPSGTRSPGNTQADDNKSHNHGVTDPGHRHIIEVRGGTESGSHVYPAHSRYPTEANNWSRVAYTGISIQAAGGTEARPKNVAVLYCKYDGSGPSLRAYKEDIKNLAMGLDTVMKLRPVQYMWKKEKGGYADFGFIAEEVEAVSPLLANYSDTQLTGVKYDHMTALLAKAIQELKAENDTLKARLDRLEKASGAE